jgi:hypothetical protein
MALSPSVERFSSFLRDMENIELKTLHQQLVKSLIEANVITGKSIAIDSCPIVVHLKENNLKTFMKDRFDKTRKPKGDPDARLGVMIHYPTLMKKEIRYFWGYRNHIISDTVTELPIGENTKPADTSEIIIAKPLMKKTKECFSLRIEVVTGDAQFDTEDILTFIIKELGALAIIPHNPRNEQPKGYYVTIAHIAVLLVALTAHRTGQKDKIRFVKSDDPAKCTTNCQVTKVLYDIMNIDLFPTITHPLIPSLSEERGKIPALLTWLPLSL